MKTTKNLLVVFLFACATLFAQQAGSGSEANGQSDDSQGYRSFDGRDTHSIPFCLPGKVGSNPVSVPGEEAKGTPCECLDMVDRVQNPLRQACQEEYLRTGNFQLMMDCMSKIKMCRDIVARGHNEFWGPNKRHRCQTYCYEQNCKCCDEGNAEGNAWNLLHRTLVARLFAWESVPLVQEDTSVEVGCASGGAFVLKPPTPAGILYASVSHLLR